MTFHVGQKVVCIKTGPVDKRFLSPGDVVPKIGDVGTVIGLHLVLGRLHLELEEFPAADNAFKYAGWKAEGFRPLVERKTSIEVFKKLLTPSPSDAERCAAYRAPGGRLREKEPV